MGVRDDLPPAFDNNGNQLFLVSDSIEGEADVKYNQQTTLFTAEELNGSIQDLTLLSDIPEFNLDADVSDSTQAEETQVESNLEAKGDCVILYSECQFKGSSKAACGNPDEVLDFSLPILSIYVPDG
jgi:hypothetical protein